MYKKYNASDWKKYFKFSEDYTIEGMLVYGGWDKEEHSKILQESLVQHGAEFKISELADFLNRTMEFTVDGKRYWFAVSYGGALLSEYLHLACMFGSKKNILIGTCGGLFDQMNSGDFLLPTYAFGNESTTRFYQRENFDNKHFSNQELTKNLAKRIDEKYKIYQGPTMTCQAMMGETPTRYTRLVSGRLLWS